MLYRTVNTPGFEHPSGQGRRMYRSEIICFFDVNDVMNSVHFWLTKMNITASWENEKPSKT